MTAASALPGFHRLDHVSVTVPDLEAAIDFYRRAFGASVAYRMGPFDAAAMPRLGDGRDWTQAHVDVEGAVLTIAMLRIAPDLMIELFQYDKPGNARRQPPRNCDQGGHHLAFKVANIEAAIAHLEANGCRALAGPIVMDSGPTLGSRAQYLVDPWGNYMELMEYDHQAYMKDSGWTGSAV